MERHNGARWSVALAAGLRQGNALGLHWEFVDIRMIHEILGHADLRATQGSGPDTRFHDLGSGYSDTRINTDRTIRNHIRELNVLGYRVTREPAA